MRRRVTLVGIWMVGTALAIVLASLAVQLAGAKVTERSTPTVSRNQVADDLAAQAQSTSTTTALEQANGADPASGTSVAPGDEGLSSVTVAPPAGVVPSTRQGNGAPAPSSPPPPSSPTSPTTSRTPDDGRGGPPPTNPIPPTTSAPTTSPPASSEQTYVLVGGSVRMRCDGATARMISSAPSAGFRMDVRAAGPGQKVEVRFDSAGHRSEFEAKCQAGTIIAELKEEGGSSPSSS